MHSLATTWTLAITVLLSIACASDSDSGAPDAAALDASVITADPSTFKLVFRTQTTSADFARGSQQTPAERADSLCQSEADGASLAGTFRAWLSDDQSSPDDRFQHSSTPYAYLSGLLGNQTKKVIAANWDELVSGRLRENINRDQFGQTSIFDGPMWTGTLANGKSDGQSHCDNWTSEDGQSASGSDASLDSEWTTGPARSCMERGGLYCFQQ